MGPTRETVRRVRVHPSGEVRLERTPRPEPGHGEVLVRPVLVGICGSDTHAVAGEHPFIDLPYAPGHEAVGVVEAVGSGVSTCRPGDRVVLEPGLACGRCRRCAEGRYNICAELAVFGCQTDGAMSDLFTVAADRLHVLPDDVGDLAAALVEPLATPVHAVRRAGVRDGSRVVVLGAGPIGLLVVAAARAAGAAEIAVTDPMPDKRDRALRLGADLALPPDRADEIAGGVDVVFDCVATEPTVRQGIELLLKGGTFVVVGVPAGPVAVPLHLVQDREITVLGSLMYVREDVEAALRLVSRVPVDELVSAIFPLDRAAEAFAAAQDPGQVKVLVQVSGELPV
ncbi:alcohol dehydrogenase catalytic domain-containing protein [Saccharopolyspora sp. WRP15-2]|uniref:Alcohol dehydrogenase catalytic domain-containing protein n=1 Tax=Saccharopolyspora oryzae TaxID=2997343 RepID=A0ABT4V4U6_9PSEU|nr:alcohol dehydrogenase catalytic domain-containing protein [Saccharopolyspora oryzae]MDA3629001.1 alcohol dehydrogenase catalytic domain-containing protein [Saccharopolyspora oryzae]